MLQYQSISEQLENYILEQGLCQHTQLPSERELCGMFNWNRVTLRTAIKLLVRQGVLYSIHGKGTYVAEKKIERNLWEFLSFSKAIQKSGVQLDTSLIGFRIVAASKKLVNALQIPLGEPIYEIRRLRIVNKVPLALELAYIAESYVPGLTKERMEGQSLYELLSCDYNIQLVKGTQELSICYPLRDDAVLLEIDENTATLMMRGVAYDEGGRSIEYSESITRGDRCIFTSVLREG